MTFYFINGVILNIILLFVLLPYTVDFFIFIDYITINLYEIQSFG